MSNDKIISSVCRYKKKPASYHCPRTKFYFTEFSPNGHTNFDQHNKSDSRTTAAVELQSYYTYCHLLQCDAEHGSTASQVWSECYVSFHGDGCFAAAVACCQKDATS
jgi:hypothetical protein